MENTIKNCFFALYCKNHKEKLISHICLRESCKSNRFLCKICYESHMNHINFVEEFQNFHQKNLNKLENNKKFLDCILKEQNTFLEKLNLNNELEKYKNEFNKLLIEKSIEKANEYDSQKKIKFIDNLEENLYKYENIMNNVKSLLQVENKTVIYLEKLLEITPFLSSDLLNELTEDLEYIKLPIMKLEQNF